MSWVEQLMAITNQLQRIVQTLETITIEMMQEFSQGEQE